MKRVGLTFQRGWLFVQIQSQDNVVVVQEGTSDLLPNATGTTGDQDRSPLVVVAWDVFEEEMVDPGKDNVEEDCGEEEEGGDEGKVEGHG